MVATYNFDEPVNGTLAATDGTQANLPIEPRNFSRDRLATVSGTITFDNSYPAGGYAVGTAKFGMAQVSGVLFDHPPGYVMSYNRATDKIQVFEQGAAAGALTEVPAATNLSALAAVYFEAKGRQY